MGKTANETAVSKRIESSDMKLIDADKLIERLIKDLKYLRKALDSSQDVNVRNIRNTRIDEIGQLIQLVKDAPGFAIEPGEGLNLKAGQTAKEPGPDCRAVPVDVLHWFAEALARIEMPAVEIRDDMTEAQIKTMSCMAKTIEARKIREKLREIMG